VSCIGVLGEPRVRFLAQRKLTVHLGDIPFLRPVRLVHAMSDPSSAEPRITRRLVPCIQRRGATTAAPTKSHAKTQRRKDRIKRKENESGEDLFPLCKLCYLLFEALFCDLCVSLVAILRQGTGELGSRLKLQQNFQAFRLRFATREKLIRLFDDEIAHD
jgi:hypothetical protein